VASAFRRKVYVASAFRRKNLFDRKHNRREHTREHEETHEKHAGEFLLRAE
jgi:hypothetical protein